MSTHPTDTPPTAPAGAALPVPTAVPCAECGTKGGYVPRSQARPWRARGLCARCYGVRYYAGTLAEFEQNLHIETFTGFPEGYTHEPTGWPIVPALVAPLHPTLPAPDRWSTATPLSRTEQAWIQRRRYVREIGRIERNAA